MSINLHTIIRETFFERSSLVESNTNLIMRKIWNKRSIFIFVGIVLTSFYLVLQFSSYQFKDVAEDKLGLGAAKASHTNKRSHFPRGVQLKADLLLKANRDSRSGENKCEVNTAVILCQDNNMKYGIGTKTAGDFSRQINQTVVMLKSIALLTKLHSQGKGNDRYDCVNVIILSDTQGHYRSLLNRIDKSEKWTEEFRRTIKLSYVPVKYPTGSQWMRKLFRPCATLRLFLAELLPSYDSLIYLDTDIIFFQNVQNLWAEFAKFPRENSPAAAMAPCLFHYGTTQNEVPFYGTSGLNAGIMLMNLTTMRNSLWTHKIRMVTTMFQQKIKLADQDILNIYFHFFPEQLHLLTCDWNFRPFQCREGSFCEGPTISNGISALHGNALSFTSEGPEPLFHTIYETFRKLKLDRNFSLEYFVDDLDLKLIENEEKYRLKGTTSPCTDWGKFTSLILKRFESNLNVVESVMGDVFYDENQSYDFQTLDSTPP